VVHRIDPDGGSQATSPLRAGVRSAVELPEDLQLLLAPSPLRASTLHPAALAAVRRFTESIKELTAAALSS
jgi:hypothetical protein